ncbi:hypothetical protein DMUE_5337 [Dictyocoela muelleri]|nr:hypothetical protein DMUE_5337 [Dictyocoela muelleri]
MILDILNSLPQQFINYKLTYNNSYALLFRKVPNEYKFIFRYSNLFILFFILKRIQKSINIFANFNQFNTKNEEQKLKSKFNIIDVKEIKNGEIETKNNKIKKNKISITKKNMKNLCLISKNSLLNKCKIFKNFKKNFRNSLKILNLIFTKENNTIFSSLFLIYKYSSSPLIQFQLFISGLTFLLILYPSLYFLASFNLTSHIFIFFRFFKKAINPKIPLKNLFNYFYYLIPLSFHIIIYLYSLDFIPQNASFDYIKGFRSMEKVDMYVLDRSIITLINEHNQIYLNGNQKMIGGNKKVKSIWRIIKAHHRDDQNKNKPIDHLTEHELLFIKNNDTIMLENIYHDKYLKSEQCDKKFCSCSLEKKYEYWKIISDTDYVMTRKSKIRFQNLTTGKYLSMKDKQFYTSFDLLHKTRDFYVEDAKMEDFYKKYLPNEKVKFEVSKYPKTKNYKRAIELFIKNLENNKNFYNFLFLKDTKNYFKDQKKYFKEEKNYFKDENIEINLIIHNLGTIGTIIILFITMINYILHKKYNFNFYFKDFVVILIYYFISLIPMMTLGTTIDFYMSCSYAAILSLIVFYLKYIEN